MWHHGIGGRRQCEQNRPPISTQGNSGASKGRRWAIPHESLLSTWQASSSKKKSGAVAQTVRYFTTLAARLAGG